MPTYEFTCPDGHDFDKFFRSMASAPTVVPCPVCGKPADRQVSAGAGLVFHGTGFYITDYGKDGKKDQKSSIGRRSGSHTSSDAGSKSGDSNALAAQPGEAKSDSVAPGSAAAGSKSGGESASEPARAPQAAAPPKASE